MKHEDHIDMLINSSKLESVKMSLGYSSFLAEVNDLAKLNKLSGEQLATQMENQPLLKIPKLSDNKKFLGRLYATQRYVTYERLPLSDKVLLTRDEVRDQGLACLQAYAETDVESININKAIAIARFIDISTDDVGD